ncbi:hypothetical protein EN817_09140 [Mesorhizobium sp. M3A.F.Ca.ET.174.01.1.1]|nr:hypothetical protein EJ074_08280 [Mesorhizobium sp. M3A.F.Ca.ET.080.04.2.1]PBB87522.1 hypothetical protein CK216_07505 [Mesorhizobium sp. WSM3876]RWB74348.1 MAG: hypothetical protein EOQ49_07935 [Mesorhizobium sp.]TGS71882.1 hypothetical protein EN844_02610 [Mesorhizobium sp. M3A.F.Ca.ET.201.01.1.1]TGS87555.1 hypothetical protein EN818_09140 [Mesorhizobium sp. M3A.F.Ca.ET.175.01.1.1]TGT28015.1 hypothetical protein EN817_09140 [Mesorhizobium sp. M3A.F.Ca.ET.174.01.1.1]TGT61337.1 hypothetica
MGMVLSFVPRTARINRASHDTATAAAVIIFPGVRYEQQPQGGQARPSGVDPGKPGSPRPPVPHH